MARGKRKNRGNGSDSDQNVNETKHFKSGQQSDSDNQLSVSEILTEANKILYDTDDTDRGSGATYCVEQSGIGEDSVFHTDTSTLKSDCKTTSSHATMANSGQKSPGKDASKDAANANMTDKQQLSLLVQTVLDIKSGQDSMRRMFESKLDKLRGELMTNIDTKVRALKDELCIDIARETNRIDDVLTTVRLMEGRLQSLEQQCSHQTINNGTSDTNEMHSTATPDPRGNPLDDPNRTVTASGLQVAELEDPIQVAQDLVNSLGTDVGENVKVTAAVRLPARFHDRPPILKFSLNCHDQKVTLLRKKSGLRFIDRFKHVQIRSSKSRIERLIEMNARAVLQTLPHGRSFRVDASGRIKPRNQQDRGQNSNTESRHEQQPSQNNQQSRHPQQAYTGNQAEDATQ